MASEAERRLTPALAIGFLVAQALLATVSVRFRPESLPLSLWWPATGLAVVVLVLTRRRDWPLVTALVLLGTSAGNLFSGSRELETAVLFGLGNAIEAPITAGLLIRRWSGALRSVRDLWRLLGCAFVGAAASGLLPSAILAATSTTGFWGATGCT